MLRGITRFFVGIILFFLAVVVLVVGIVTVRLLDASVYKAAMQNSGAYTQIAQQAQTETGSLSSAISLDDSELTLVVQKAVDAELKDSMANFLNADSIKNLVDRNLDNIGGYLNSYTDILNVYFPKSDIRALLQEGASNVADRVGDLIATLPTCNGEQPAKTEAELSCVTARLKTDDNATAFLDEILPANGDDALAGFEILEGEDQQPLGVYVQQVGTDNSEQLREVITTLAEVRSLVSTVKLLLLISIVLTLFFFVVYIALKKGGFLTKTKSALKMVFFIGMGITALSGVSLLVVSFILSSTTQAGLAADSGLGAFAPTIFAVIKDVFGQILIPILLVAAGVSFISFVVWLILHLISSAIKTVE